MRLIRAVALLAISVFIPIFALADTTGSVRGYVVAGSYHHDYVQRLISRVVVTYSSPAGDFSARTDRSGFYTIVGIRPGKYVIDVRVPGEYDLLLGPEHVCIHAGKNFIP